MESILDRVIPAYYNTSWHELLLNIEKYGVDEGYNKMIKEFKFSTKGYSGYYEMVSGYINDYDKIKSTVNPDYFNFVNLENLNEQEKKVVIILAASLELRVNKPLFDVIFDKIICDYKLKGKYKYILAKYILKYKVCRNEKYVLKNLLNEIFHQNILYYNKKTKTWIIYINEKESLVKLEVLNSMKNIFFKAGDKMKIYWKQHFNIIDHKEVSKLNMEIIF